MYLALIADVIDSKMVQERLDLQKQIEKTLQKINELFKDCLASAFTLTLGDEFQALLEVDAPVFQIIDTLRLELNPTQLRFGSGLGEIVTAIENQDMDMAYRKMQEHIIQTRFALDLDSIRRTEK